MVTPALSRKLVPVSGARVLQPTIAIGTTTHSL
jgi:hypothetical protein